MPPLNQSNEKPARLRGQWLPKQRARHQPRPPLHKNRGGCQQQDARTHTSTQGRGGAHPAQACHSSGLGLLPRIRRLGALASEVCLLSSVAARMRAIRSLARLPSPWISAQGTPCCPASLRSQALLRARRGPPQGAALSLEAKRALRQRPHLVQATFPSGVATTSCGGTSDRSPPEANILKFLRSLVPRGVPAHVPLNLALRRCETALPHLLQQILAPSQVS